MKEYIERSAAIACLRKYGCNNGSALGHHSGAVDCAEADIKNIPAADVVKAVHGEWVKWYPPMHMIMTGEEMLYRCSVCDAKYPDVEGYRYCPYCGAKMDFED